MPNTTRLIEEWLPIKEIGIECRRERQASSALPPLYFLHVWWARRPLTASRAAILGALLPAWQGNEALLQRHFHDRQAYYAWFRRMLGILGDPVAAQDALDRARRRGQRIQNPNEYPRAFSMVLDVEHARLLLQIMRATLGRSHLLVMDPMAGGGSIPFEALRVGFSAISNELNPVATVVLAATLDAPLRWGKDLTAHIQAQGQRWLSACRQKLAELFPAPLPDETPMAYLWARTVPCPVTGKPVPLAPNWWLRRQPDGAVAARLLPCQPDWPECRFEIVRGKQADLEKRYAPDQGTVRRGNAISPWSGDPIPGDYIKKVAQEGRMGAQLYALCVDRGAGRDFRLPTAEDLAGVRRAEAALAARWAAWEAQGLIPTEDVPEGNKTAEPLRYGMRRWCDLFSPRQLLALVTYLATLRELAPAIERDLGPERAAAVRTYLALVLDKCADYNCLLATWEVTRVIAKHWAQRHDFSLKWTFAEMNMALRDKGGFPWALKQVVDAYEGLCDLLQPARPLFPVEAWQKRPPARVMRANAAALRELPDASLDAVVVDPPYGNNVMYAELSDFFYVWLKRSVGDLYPDWFATALTDKHAEAVANPALFKSAKDNPVALATRDYLLKMRRVFREMRRVVKPEGAMVVMFTHRETEMWNALGLALLETGWEIGSSWPVHTESEHSLHQAKKNAARSTILLFCRPRASAAEPTYWDSALQQAVRATARRKAQEYQEAGIAGVDLHLATYGPVLGVLSRHWPIISAEVDRESGEPKPLQPEEALSVARREVFAMRREQILNGRPATWDAATDWYLLAWDNLKAREFPFDEARKLALSWGVDIGDLIQRHALLGRRADTVRFLRPEERLGESRVNPKAVVFGRLVDALHTALYLYASEGDRECRRFLERTGLLRDPDFKTLVQAAIRVIPGTQQHDRSTKRWVFVVPEAETLERVRVTFFPDLEAAKELAEERAAQAEMDLGADEEDEEE